MQKNDHNTRDCKISFHSHEQGVCHGIAGYFETVLYASSTAKVELSTNPVTMEEKSKDMISWFPIFFPLKVRFYEYSWCCGADLLSDADVYSQER